MQELEILELFSKKITFDTRDGRGVSFATNPYKLVAQELGIENVDGVKDTIDQLVEDEYLSDEASIRLYISENNNELPSLITDKGREKLRELKNSDCVGC